MYIGGLRSGEAFPQNDDIGAAGLQITDLRQASPFGKALRLKEGEARRIVREDDRQHVFDIERGRAAQHVLQEPFAEAAAAFVGRDVDADFGADAVGLARVVVAETAPGGYRAVRVFDDVKRAVALMRRKPCLPRGDAYRREVGGSLPACNGAVVNGDDGGQVIGTSEAEGFGHNFVISCVFPVG